MSYMEELIKIFEVYDKVEEIIQFNLKGNISSGDFKNFGHIADIIRENAHERYHNSTDVSEDDEHNKNFYSILLNEKLSTYGKANLLLHWTDNLKDG